MEQYRERNSTLPYITLQVALNYGQLTYYIYTQIHLDVVAIEKEAYKFPSTVVGQLI